MPEPARRRPPSTSVKVVITGPYGVGKTTLIRTLSEINVLTTERRVTDDPGARRSATTVAMDFGRITIDEDLQLYLFGTPGQKRFDSMWETLGEGMLGFIVMLDDDRAGSLLEGIEILDYFRARADVPFVVAVNKVAVGEEVRAVRRARHQLRMAADVPVVTVDARDREQAKDLLVELFHAARALETRMSGGQVEGAEVAGGPESPESPESPEAAEAAESPRTSLTPVGLEHEPTW